ncbi:hypothetical protein F4778DRAFT_714707 [Xylariomycetidae sp. FL2044]|nr:hypothetical protein F4778DRAFT_714707 [Xylariomycetidae sp. FL2044]
MRWYNPILSGTIWWLASSGRRCLAAIPAKWSSKTLGPDGPWHAVELQMGNLKNNIAVFPGGNTNSSYFLTTSYCDGAETCYAEEAGLYDPSLTSGNGSTGSLNPLPLSPTFDIVSRPGALDIWLDDLYFDSGEKVDNMIISLMDQGDIKLPGGGQYPFTAGCFNIGHPGTQRVTYSTKEAGKFYGNWIANSLQLDSYEVSMSFGMHYTSTITGPPPSLYWGGYDRNRVLGNVYTLQGGFTTLLLDISINVIDGHSPFPFQTKSGLLSAGNSSMALPLSTGIDPCAPYIYLPRSSCDAITESLPVTYDESLGLYLWDQTSPDYPNIVNSASALSFTFTSSTTENVVTIHVPFKHLNLTLEAPITPDPIPYFPCRPSDNHNLLGRAFIQDAFLGEDYYFNKDDGLTALQRGMFFMAQAPGPNISEAPAIANFSGGLHGYKFSTLDWATSWDGHWTPLSAEQAWNYTHTADDEAQQTAPDDNGDTPSSSTPAPGAVAGIAVGGVAAVVLAGSAVFLWLRWRRGKPVVIYRRILLPGKRKQTSAAPTPEPKEWHKHWAEVEGRGVVAELQQPTAELSVVRDPIAIHELSSEPRQ